MCGIQICITVIFATKWYDVVMKFKPIICTYRPSLHIDRSVPLLLPLRFDCRLPQIYFWYHIAYAIWGISASRIIAGAMTAGYKQSFIKPASGRHGLIISWLVVTSYMKQRMWLFMWYSFMLQLTLLELLHFHGKINQTHSAKINIYIYIYMIWNRLK